MMSVLTLEKWLPMSTTFVGLPFLPNLATDQIKIELTDEQMVNSQCSALWTSDCLLLVLNEFSITSMPGYHLRGVFRSWLILSTAHIAYHYLVQRQIALWIQMRTPSDLRGLRKAPVLWCKMQSPKGNINSQCGCFPPLEIPVGRQMNQNKIFNIFMQIIILSF